LRPLCDICFRFRLEAQPACARCAYETSTRKQRRISLAIVFLCFAWSSELWALRRYPWLQESYGFLVFAAVVAAPLVAYLIARSGRSALPSQLTHRPPGDDPRIADSETSSTRTARLRVRRILLAAAPRVSGTTTTLVVGASLLVTAVLVPVSLRLPRWLEVESVLVLWWVIMALTLGGLLYRGFRLHDDYLFVFPWNRTSLGSPSPKGSAEELNDVLPAKKRFEWLDGCSPFDLLFDGEGLVFVVLFLGIVFGAAWIVIELAAPLMLFFVYRLLMRSLEHVARDPHACEGDVVRASLWGCFWATLYVVPLGIGTWILHALVGVH